VTGGDPIDYRTAVLDAAVIISFIKGEEGRAEAVRDVLQAAESGEVEIYLPAVAAAEVLRWRGEETRDDVDVANDRQLRRFLDGPVFKWVDVDPELGHRAREIAREHGLKNGIDAIYIATAERVGAPVMMTWDERTIPHGDYADVRVTEVYRLGQRRPNVEGAQDDAFDT
jgi:predicted nucleic acid-binding protein